MAIYRLPGGGCADTPVRRREYVHVGSAETSLFRKLTCVSTLGIQRLFDLAAFDTVNEVLANI